MTRKRKANIILLLQVMPRFDKQNIFKSLHSRRPWINSESIDDALSFGNIWTAR